MMAARRLARALLLAVVFSGCASLPPAYKEGMRLIDAGMTEQGIAQLEQASREAPGNPEVRGRLMRERELASARFNEAGAAARADGRARDAELAYRRALHVNSNDERAKLGLERLAMDRRHAESIKNAEALVAKRDLAGAQALLRAVLTEDPKNRTARAQLNSIASALAWNASTRRELKAAAGKRISLQFRDATLKQVFDMIARNAGINFAFDKDVRSDARITISIRNATVDDVIQLILATNQLERKVLNDSTLLIYPNTPAKQREHQELMVRSFYISNADVSKVLGMLKAVMKTRDAFVDEKLNLLVIRDTPEAIRLAEKLIAAQDRADPEVTLDVEVLEVSSTYLRNIGPQFPEKINFQSPATVSTGTAAAAALQRVSDPLVAFVATPAVILNLKQQDGVTNLLANPRIRVKNREKAKIHIGDKVPVVTTTAAVNVGTSSSVNYLDVGLKLEVEPSIRIEGDVEIKVGLEVSNIVKEVPVPNGGLAYQIGTRNASTVLRLADGETQVLAGLIQDDDRNTTSKVPGLGDLPLLGRLFGSKNASRTKNEIVLLITPRIARNIAPPEPEIAELFFGTDSSVGASPLLASPGGMAMAATAPGKPEAEPAGKRPIPGKPIALTMAAPLRAQLGSELTVELVIPADPRVASGLVRIRYDPAVLALGAGEPKAPGEHTVEVRDGSEPSEVRVPFRVIAKAPGTTQVSLIGVSLLDRGGRPLSVVPVGVAAIELYQ